jgi:UDP-N-acetylenolpyruvoylglucosamine reductase
VSNTDNNKQDDTDVLRAENILSPYNKEKSSEQDLPATEIPKFDLAEQIMAEQRKVTAIRRKAPGKKTKTSDSQPRTQSTGCTFKQPAPTSLEKGIIIADIVARDIEQLYRGDSSSLRN